MLSIYFHCAKYHHTIAAVACTCKLWPHLHILMALLPGNRFPSAVGLKYAFLYIAACLLTIHLFPWPKAMSILFITILPLIIYYKYISTHFSTHCWLCFYTLLTLSLRQTTQHLVLIALDIPASQCSCIWCRLSMRYCTLALVPAVNFQCINIIQILRGMFLYFFL